jgi:hypothetical protein
MGTPVPSLSSIGWIRDAVSKADTLLSHFYVSDKRQTALYGNNVSNIQGVLQRSGHDIVALTQELRLELTKYLERYYDTVNVDVRAQEITEEGVKTGKYTLRIYCMATEDGQQYSFGKLLQISNSKLINVFKLNNEGKETE